MDGRENRHEDTEFEDQDAEPTLNAPGDEGPTGTEASDESSAEG